MAEKGRQGQSLAQEVADWAGRLHSDLEGDWGGAREADMAALSQWSEASRRMEALSHRAQEKIGMLSLKDDLESEAKMVALLPLFELFLRDRRSWISKVESFALKGWDQAALAAVEAPGFNRASQSDEVDFGALASAAIQGCCPAFARAMMKRAWPDSFLSGEKAAAKGLEIRSSIQVGLSTMGRAAVKWGNGDELAKSKRIAPLMEEVARVHGRAMAALGLDSEKAKRTLAADIWNGIRAIQQERGSLNNGSSGLVGMELIGFMGRSGLLAAPLPMGSVSLVTRAVGWGPAALLAREAEGESAERDEKGLIALIESRDELGAKLWVEAAGEALSPKALAKAAAEAAKARVSWADWVSALAERAKLAEGLGLPGGERKGPRL